MIENIGNFKDKNDGTIKSVYDVGYKKIIEMSVLYNKNDKDVICVPTHHFCNLGCKMCHLTNKGLNKAMNKIKINDFLYCLIDTLKKFKTDKKKLLISFMGVGEPLLNIELITKVYESEYVIKSLGYDDISYALSTMMPNDNLNILCEAVNKLNMPLKVHFSLHTPINDARKRLIPSTNVDIESALKLLVNYKNTIIKNRVIMNNYKKFHRNSIPIELHYTLIDGVNDSNVELDRLIEILKRYNVPIKFIKFNPNNDLERSNKEDLWINKIRTEMPDLIIKSYAPPGRDVGSSCGEFTKHYYHYEIESKEELNKFLQWEKDFKI